MDPVARDRAPGPLREVRARSAGGREVIVDSQRFREVHSRRSSPASPDKPSTRVVCGPSRPFALSFPLLPLGPTLSSPPEDPTTRSRAPVPFCGTVDEGSAGGAPARPERSPVGASPRRPGRSGPRTQSPTRCAPNLDEMTPPKEGPF